MRDVVIIGGGLSGLAAAYALEQRQINYTLIEVKRRLGGSIRTVAQDGFLIDAGAFALVDTLDADFLASLDLSDALYPLSDHAVAFKTGTETLVQALAERITAPRMMRMAVSSIGELDNGRCGICLENGLLLDAKAVIVALPARYAARLFYSYRPAIGKRLAAYHYDQMLRVSLGFRASEVPENLRTIPNVTYVFKHRTDHTQRVPEGHVLWQFGLRYARLDYPLQQAIPHIMKMYNLPQPLTQRVDQWAEADPISCYADDHPQTINDIRAQLPPHIALIGSDYSLTQLVQLNAVHLAESIAQGQRAAQEIADWLTKK